MDAQNWLGSATVPPINTLPNTEYETANITIDTGNCLKGWKTLLDQQYRIVGEFQGSNFHRFYRRLIDHEILRILYSA